MITARVVGSPSSRADEPKGAERSDQTTESGFSVDETIRRPEWDDTPVGEHEIAIDAWTPSEASDKLQYAKDYGEALYTYDARTHAPAEKFDALRLWVHPELWDDPENVMSPEMLREWVDSRFLSDQVLNQEHASFEATQAVIPDGFTRFRDSYYSEFDEEPVWLVTIGGVQTIERRDRDPVEIFREATVAIICDGENPCSAIGPGNRILR